jgi:hypothetical protein
MYIKTIIHKHGGGYIIHVNIMLCITKQVYILFHFGTSYILIFHNMSISPKLSRIHV